MAAMLWPENVVFSTALALMLGIGLLEGTMTLLGMGMSGVIDNMLPDIPDADLDIGVDGDIGFDAGMDAPNALSQFLGWLMIGRVPALAVLVVFLTVFGLAGLIVQSAIAGVFGGPLTPWLAAPVVAAGALPLTRVVALGLSRVMPKDESSAVSRTSFVGRVAVVTLGTARRGAPTQARLTDQHGQSHYVMVEPDLDDEQFATGEEVLLVRQAGSLFRVIAAGSAALRDDQNHLRDNT